jgi:hypothetical protein
VNDEANNGEGAKKRTNEMNPKRKDNLYKKIQTIKSYLSIVPQVIFEELNQGNKVTNIQDVFSSSCYGELTGDTEGLLAYLVNDNILSSRSLTNRVSLTVTSISHSMKDDSCKTLFDLMISGNTQQGIPPELFDTMILA